MTKAALRKIYLDKRGALTTEEAAMLNDSLCRQFFAAINASLYKSIHTFLPLSKLKEPNTFLIINEFTKSFPDVQIAVPRVNGESGEIDSFIYKGSAQLKTNTWGIPEPVSGVPVEPDQFDLVIVPLLAFDERGHRLGYGKGFYDKFLKRCTSQCVKVGLSFFGPESLLPSEAHDVALNSVVTPDKIYKF